MNAPITVCYAPPDYLELADALALEQPRVNVVIDVLRATSTIITGLGEGASGFHPVLGVEEARQLRASHTGALLAGERGGLPPEGFDRGNSPREFRGKEIQGREIILTTTNGTAAFLACPPGEIVIAAGFLNLGAVANRVRSLNLPLRIICAGTGPDFSLEDALVAGALITQLKSDHPAGAIYRSSADRLLETLLSTANGRRLVKLGLSEDIVWCAQQDRYTGVPELNSDGWIR